MIDLINEKLIPLAQAARGLPPARQGRCTHISTLIRWIIHGCRSPSGEVVRLEAIRLGCRWMTSQEALQRFVDRLTPRIEDNPPGQRPQTVGQRSRASQRAAEELKKFGI